MSYLDDIRDIYLVVKNFWYYKILRRPKPKHQIQGAFSLLFRAGLTEDFRAAYESVTGVYDMFVGIEPDDADAHLFMYLLLLTLADADKNSRK